MRTSFIFISILFALTANAEGGKCAITDIGSFARDFSSSFKNGSLLLLDNKYCIESRLHIEIDHSIRDQKVESNVRSFTELDVWLNKQKNSDGFPTPGVWTLIDCHSNLCTFAGNDANQLHNHLFLKTIGYGFGKGGAVITNIIFEDGD